MRFRHRPTIVEAEQWSGDNLDKMPKGSCRNYFARTLLMIETPEGEISASLGDWVVTSAAGEIYVVKDAIFRRNYELVNEEAEF
jgi:hypothetical protein